MPKINYNLTKQAFGAGGWDPAANPSSSFGGSSTATPTAPPAFDGNKPLYGNSSPAATPASTYDGNKPKYGSPSTPPPGASPGFKNTGMLDRIQSSAASVLGTAGGAASSAIKSLGNAGGKALSGLSKYVGSAGAPAPAKFDGSKPLY